MLFGISTNLGQNIRSVDKLPLHCGCHVGTPPSLYAKLNKVRWNTSPNNGIAFGQTKNLADLNLGKVYISIIYPILVSGLYLLNGWNLCICCIQAVWNLLQLILKLFVLLGISTNLGQNTGSVDKLLLHCSCHLVPLQRVHGVSMQSPIELGETLLQIMVLHLGKWKTMQT